MQIRNFFISETTKNKELNKSRLSYRKKVSKNNPLKIYSKKIMSNYQSFGLNYFDNSKIGIGYGNYIKDNRFKGPISKIIKFFKLKANSKILEIGCAKGFILDEFLKKKMNVYGVDVSSYAIKKSLITVKKKIILKNLSKNKFFKDNYFDFIISKEVIPHLSKTEIKQLIMNINAISKDHKKIYFIIQVPSMIKYKKNFKNWDVTHKSIMTEIEWIKFLEKNKFKGKVAFKELV
jgi:cyclopropane fatty-acyl-phospholipid synthase-like methyltransferase